jgi:ribosomal protein L7Ae-like RNA K-turn-binding protein
MPDVDKVKTLIGFANRAGKLVIGRSAVAAAQLRRKLSLVIIAEDASYKNDLIIHAEGNVPLLRFGNKEMMGKWLGRQEVAILGITDAQFAASLKKMLV